MSQGKVTVNNLNLGQGDFPEIERKPLFIGVATKNVDSVVSIDSQSNLDDLLGVATSVLKTNVAAAIANAGENFQGWAIPMAANGDWKVSLDKAMLVCSPELIAVTTPTVTKADVTAGFAKVEGLRTSLARRAALLLATANIDPATQTWSAYEASQILLQAGVSAYRNALVPQLHGCDVGALVGRLCNRSVTVADTPMRVKTGTMIGLDNDPVDKDGVSLPAATLKNLDDNRLSVIQRYVDYPGTFWGDCNLLDEPGGDYQVIEHLRVVDKVCRAIRIQAIQKIGNRELNSSAASIAAHKTYFSKIIRQMSKPIKIGSDVFPGECYPPSDDAITIVWLSKTSVAIYVKVRPYECAKDITANIMLDLTLE